MTQVEDAVVREVCGYLDSFSYTPGSSLELHAAGDGPARVWLAEMRAEASAEASTVHFDRLSQPQPIEVELKPRRVRRGSYIRVDRPWANEVAPFRLETHIRSINPDITSVIADWVWSGLACTVTAEDGLLKLTIAADSIECVAIPLPSPLRWHRLNVEIDPDGQFAVAAGGNTARGNTPSTTTTSHYPDELRIGSRRGSDRGELDGCVASIHCQVWNVNRYRDLGKWDLGVGDRTEQILDRSSNEKHGVAVGSPVRGIPGPAWKRSEVDPRLAPDEFDATRFHADDLSDVGWPVTIDLEIPEDLASGAYAVVIEADTETDHVPFFVLPGADERGRVAFLVSTFTYQAYANANLGDRIDYVEAGISGRPYTPGKRDLQIARNLIVAGSLYDVHSDGSGRCFSTRLRPIFNFRADFLSAVQQAPRHLGADLLILEWLKREVGEVDVLTDHDLHRGGGTLLEDYEVVVTSSHPEYVSSDILDALEQHLARGGNLMYLGGNGFYWVTTTNADGTIIECRRGNAGTRTWDSPPAEVHHFQTGELGGLWRHRGRSPNSLVGIGMASQGWDERATPFRTRPEVLAPDSGLRWLFEGMRDPERFGDRGLVMGGASGDELDRWDPECGSPPEAVVVATSERHSRHYMLVHEDVLMSEARLGGDVNDKVRSDIVWYETGSGGTVFSVGSITWAGALAYNDYDNDVAVISRNVLKRMLGETS